MLGKLYKYEFKSTSRWMLPSYLFLLIMSVINMMLVNRTNDSGIFMEYMIGDSLIGNMLKSLFVMAYGIAIAAVGMITTFVIVTRFYKNLLSNEGYISMTLPVSIDEHICVKLVTALVWTFASVLMIMLSYIIVLAPTGVLSELAEAFEYFPEAWNMINAELGGKLGLYVANFVMNALVAMVQAILMFYFAMAVGQLSNNHKIGMSVIAYIVMNFVVQIVASLLLGNMILDLVYVSDGNAIVSRMSQYGFTSLVIGIIVTAGCYFGTRYILTKRINLQ